MHPKLFKGIDEGQQNKEYVCIRVDMDVLKGLLMAYDLCDDG